MTVGELMEKLAKVDPSWPVTACVGPDGDRVEISIIDFDVMTTNLGGGQQEDRQVVVLDG